MYLNAFSAYELDRRNPTCLRGIQTNLVSIANMAMNAGNLELAKASVKDALSFTVGIANTCIDVPTLFRLRRAMARLVTFVAVMEFVTGEDKTDLEFAPDAVFAEEEQLPLKAPSGLHMLAIKYEWGCHHILRNDTEEARRIFQEQAARAERLEELDTAFMYQLGLIKIRVIEGATSPVDIDNSVQIGTMFLNDCHMPNGYADAIGTAYVIAVLRGSPEHSENALRESARSAYAAIDKSWKFELLDRVGGEEFNPMALFLP